MYFSFIYNLGKRFKFFPEVKQLDERLHRVEFPYNSSEILSGILLFLIPLLLIAGLIFPFFNFLSFLIAFFAIVISAAAYAYAVAVYYSIHMIEYSEEMLRAILRISTYISLNTSIEYAFVQGAEHARGTLKKQLTDIKENLESKKFTTLGDAIADYISVWNEANPDFIKSLRLLQTAAVSLQEDRQRIVNEVLETIILSYHNSGKRFAEELSHKTKTLIAVGVLLPMMSLMLLPLISIFMPQLASASLLAFVYDVFFPTVLLLMAMQFSSKRIQVSTIRIEESPYYQKTSSMDFFIPIAIAAILAVPAILHVATIDFSNSETIAREYAFQSIAILWLSLLGIAIAVGYFCHKYIKRNEKLWQEVSAIEQDIPHLLQIFSSYLAMNKPVESILMEIEEDYKSHGFKTHPVVKIFSEIKSSMLTAKVQVEEMAKTLLPKICPSKRFSELFEQIVSFTTVDQASAARAAKMIREQVVSIHKLDDYLQTLLSETTGLVNITATMLAPLLATAAIIMSMGIVMSLEFITKQLGIIQGSLGIGGAQGAQIDLHLVDVSKIVPPTIIELIVGIYFLEMVIVLSVFMSNVRVGSDKFKTVQTIYSNLLLSFVIYTLLLFMGYFIFREVVFAGILRGVQ